MWPQMLFTHCRNDLSLLFVIATALTHDSVTISLGVTYKPWHKVQAPDAQFWFVTVSLLSANLRTDVELNVVIWSESEMQNKEWRTVVFKWSASKNFIENTYWKNNRQETGEKRTNFTAMIIGCVWNLIIFTAVSLLGKEKTSDSLKLLMHHLLSDQRCLMSHRELCAMKLQLLTMNLVLSRDILLVI